MPTSIKPGSQVTVIEGADRGERGKVTSIARRYDEGSGQTTKMVTFENEEGRRVTTRLSWVREL